MISVRGVKKSFNGKPAVNEAAFEVGHGEWLGIIGPNGSGKSTLLRIVSGIERAESGDVCYENRSVYEFRRKELARFVAVLQQDALPPAMFTVREVVEMGRYPFQNWLGEDQDRGRSIVDAMMDRLCIAHLADRRLDALSGGERQRVALAKAMAQEPRVLLLDEPTTFLDIGYQVQMMDYVQTWQRESGLTVIAVLHDLNLASQYCDRIAAMKEGRILRIGTPEQLMQTDFIRDVYGTEPYVIAHPENGRPQILLRPGSWQKHTDMIE